MTEVIAMEATSVPVREPISLRQPRKLTMQELQNQAKIGQAIANQRIRDRWALDQARAEKQEWVSRVSASLESCFSSTRVAERFNDWPARILPEYAELDAFIAMFGQEMKHRLGRLQGIINHLADVPESVLDNTATVSPTTAPARVTNSTQIHDPGNAPTDPADFASLGATGNPSITATGSSSIDAADKTPTDAVGKVSLPMDHSSGLSPRSQYPPHGTPNIAPQDCLDAEDNEDCADIDEPAESSVTLVDPNEPAERLAAPPAPQAATKQPSLAANETAMNIAAMPSPSLGQLDALKNKVDSATVVETTILLVAGAPEQPAVGQLRLFLEKMGLKLDLVHCPPGGVVLGLEGRSPRVSFALILLEGPAETPTDGKHPDLGQRLFDLGYCAGRVGPASVCALHDSGESHTDALGIMHLAMDRSDGWQLQLGRLLRKAGVNIDLNRLV